MDYSEDAESIALQAWVNIMAPVREGFNASNARTIIAQASRDSLSRFPTEEEIAAASWAVTRALDEIHGNPTIRNPWGGV